MTNTEQPPAGQPPGADGQPPAGNTPKDKKVKEAKKSNVGVAARRRRRIVIACLLLLVLLLLGTGIGIFAGQTYLIQFNGTGGENLASMRVGRGNVALPTPVRPGHTFLGWTPEHQTQPGNFLTTTRGRSERLRAHWEETNFIINFYSEGELVNQLGYDETIGDAARPGFTTAELSGQYKNFFMPVPVGDAAWAGASFRMDPNSAHRRFLGWSFKSIDGKQEYLWAPGTSRGSATLDVPSQLPEHAHGSSYPTGWVYEYNIDYDDPKKNDLRPLTIRGSGSEPPFFPNLYDGTMHAVWEYRQVEIRVGTPVHDGMSFQPPGIGQGDKWWYGENRVAGTGPTEGSIPRSLYTGTEILVGWRIAFRSGVGVPDNNQSPLRLDEENGNIMDFDPRTSIPDSSRPKLSARQLQEINDLYNKVYPASADFYVDPLLAYLTFQDNIRHTLYFEPVTERIGAETRFYDANFNPITENSGADIGGVFHGIQRKRDGDNKEYLVFGRPRGRDLNIWEFIRYEYDIYETNSATGKIERYDIGSGRMEANRLEKYGEVPLVGPNSINEAISYGHQGAVRYPNDPDAHMHDTHAVVFYEVWEKKEVTIEFEYGTRATKNSKDHYDNGLRDVHAPTYGNAANDKTIKERYLAVPSAQSVKADVGDVITLPAASMFVRANMNFIGWQEVYNNGVLGEIYPAGHEYTVSPDLGANYKMRAIWVDSKINFSFNLAGGEGYTPQELSNLMGGGRLRDGAPARNAKLPNVIPERFGYTFMHWSSDQNPDVKYQPNDTIPVLPEKQIITAVWKALPVDLTLNVKFEYFDDKDKSYKEIAGTIEMPGFKFDETVRLHSIVNHSDPSRDPVVFTTMTTATVTKNTLTGERTVGVPEPVVDRGKIINKGEVFDSFFRLAGWTFTGRSNREMTVGVHTFKDDERPGAVNLNANAVRAVGNSLVAEGFNNNEAKTKEIAFFLPHYISARDAGKRLESATRYELTNSTPELFQADYLRYLADFKDGDKRYDLAGLLAVPKSIAEKVVDGVGWKPAEDTTTGSYNTVQEDGVELKVFSPQDGTGPLVIDSVRINEVMFFYLWLKPKKIEVQFYDFHGFVNGNPDLRKAGKEESYLGERRTADRFINLRHSVNIERARDQERNNPNFAFRHWDVEYLAYVPGHQHADSEGFVMIPINKNPLRSLCTNCTGSLIRNPTTVDPQLDEDGNPPVNAVSLPLNANAMWREDCTFNGIQNSCDSSVIAPVHTIRVKPNMRSLYEVDLHIIVEDTDVIRHGDPIVFTTTVDIINPQLIDVDDNGRPLSRQMYSGELKLTEEVILNSTIHVDDVPPGRDYWSSSHWPYSTYGMNPSLNKLHDGGLIWAGPGDYVGPGSEARGNRVELRYVLDYNGKDLTSLNVYDYDIDVSNKRVRKEPPNPINPWLNHEVRLTHSGINIENNDEYFDIRSGVVDLYAILGNYKYEIHIMDGMSPVPVVAPITTAFLKPIEIGGDEVKLSSWDEIYETTWVPGFWIRELGLNLGTVNFLSGAPNPSAAACQARNMPMGLPYCGIRYSDSCDACRVGDFRIGNSYKVGHSSGEISPRTEEISPSGNRIIKLYIVWMRSDIEVVYMINDKATALNVPSRIKMPGTFVAGDILPPLLTGQGGLSAVNGWKRPGYIHAGWTSSHEISDGNPEDDTINDFVLGLGRSGVRLAHDDVTDNRGPTLGIADGKIIAETDPHKVEITLYPYWKPTMTHSIIFDFSPHGDDEHNASEAVIELTPEPGINWNKFDRFNHLSEEERIWNRVSNTPSNPGYYQYELISGKRAFGSEITHIETNPMAFSYYHISDTDFDDPDYRIFDGWYYECPACESRQCERPNPDDKDHKLEVGENGRLRLDVVFLEWEDWRGVFYPEDFIINDRPIVIYAKWTTEEGSLVYFDIKNEAVYQTYRITDIPNTTLGDRGTAVSGDGVYVKDGMSGDVNIGAANGAVVPYDLAFERYIGPEGKESEYQIDEYPQFYRTEIAVEVFEDITRWDAILSRPITETLSMKIIKALNPMHERLACNSGCTHLTASCRKWYEDDELGFGIDNRIVIPLELPIWECGICDACEEGEECDDREPPETYARWESVPVPPLRTEHTPEGTRATASPVNSPGMQMFATRMEKRIENYHTDNFVRYATFHNRTGIKNTAVGTGLQIDSVYDTFVMGQPTAVMHGGVSIDTYDGDAAFFPGTVGSKWTRHGYELVGFAINDRSPYTGVGNNGVAYGQNNAPRGFSTLVTAGDTYTNDYLYRPAPAAITLVPIYIPLPVTLTLNSRGDLGGTYAFWEDMKSNIDIVNPVCRIRSSDLDHVCYVECGDVGYSVAGKTVPGADIVITIQTTFDKEIKVPFLETRGKNKNPLLDEAQILEAWEFTDFVSGYVGFGDKENTSLKETSKPWHQAARFHVATELGETNPADMIPLEIDLAGAWSGAARRMEVHFHVVVPQYRRDMDEWRTERLYFDRNKVDHIGCPDCPRERELGCTFSSGAYDAYESAYGEINRFTGGAPLGSVAEHYRKPIMNAGIYNHSVAPFIVPGMNTPQNPTYDPAFVFDVPFARWAAEDPELRQNLGSDWRGKGLRTLGWFMENPTGFAGQPGPRIAENAVTGYHGPVASNSNGEAVPFTHRGARYTDIYHDGVVDRTMTQCGECHSWEGKACGAICKIRPATGGSNSSINIYLVYDWVEGNVMFHGSLSGEWQTTMRGKFTWHKMAHPAFSGFLFGMPGAANKPGEYIDHIGWTKGFSLNNMRSYVQTVEDAMCEDEGLEITDWEPYDFIRVRDPVEIGGQYYKEGIYRKLEVGDSSVRDDDIITKCKGRLVWTEVYNSANPYVFDNVVRTVDNTIITNFNYAHHHAEGGDVYMHAVLVAELVEHTFYDEYPSGRRVTIWRNILDDPDDAPHSKHYGLERGSVGLQNGIMHRTKYFGDHAYGAEGGLSSKLPVPTKEGYKFLYWVDDRGKAYGNIGEPGGYDSHPVGVVLDGMPAISGGEGQTIELYAVWAPLFFEVVFCETNEVEGFPRDLWDTMEADMVDNDANGRPRNENNHKTNGRVVTQFHSGPGIRPLTIPQYDPEKHFYWSDAEKDMKFLGWMLDEKDTFFRIDTRLGDVDLHFGSFNNHIHVPAGQPYTAAVGVHDPTHPDVVKKNTTPPKECSTCETPIIYCTRTNPGDGDKDTTARLQYLPHAPVTAPSTSAFELRKVDGSDQLIWVRTVKFYASWSFGEISITYFDGIDPLVERHVQDGYLLNDEIVHASGSTYAKRSIIGADYRLAVPGIKFGDTYRDADYKQYGVMVADESIIAATVIKQAEERQKSFGGWRVRRGPVGQHGAIYLPGEFLDGFVNDSFEFEAIWYDWHDPGTLATSGTVEAECESGNIDEGVLVLPGGTQLSTWNNAPLNITNSNIHTVIVPYMGTTGVLEKDSIVAFDIERILLPSVGTLTIREQSIHSAKLIQLYLGDDNIVNEGNPVAGRATIDTSTGDIVIESSMVAYRQRQGAMKIWTVDGMERYVIQNPVTREKVRFAYSGSEYSDDEEHPNFIRGGNTWRRSDKYHYEEAESETTGALYRLNSLRAATELIAYPGKAKSVTLHTDDLTTIRRYAFAYMSNLAPESTISVETASTVRDYALFHTTAEAIILPSAGTVSETVISGYQPKLMNVAFGASRLTSVSGIGEFHNGVLYREAGATQRNQIMYVTRSVSGAPLGTTADRVTRINGTVTVHSGVTSINEYALSSFYEGAGTPIKNLAVNTTNVSLRKHHFQTDHDNSAIDEERGQQTCHLDVLRLGLLGAPRSVDHRIFSGIGAGWSIKEVRLNTTGIALTNFTETEDDEPGRNAVDGHMFPIFVGAEAGSQETARTMLNEYIGGTGNLNYGTTWGALRAYNNPRIQTLLKSFEFEADTDGTGTQTNVPTPTFHTGGTTGDFTIPGATFVAPEGSVLIGWRIATADSHQISQTIGASTTHNTDGTIYQPDWTFRVQMENSLLARNALNAWDPVNWEQEEGVHAGIYIQQAITLRAVWETSSIQFIDTSRPDTQQNISQHQRVLVHDGGTFRDFPAYGFELASLPKKLDTRGVPIAITEAGDHLEFALAGNDHTFASVHVNWHATISEDWAFVGWTGTNPNTDWRWNNNDPANISSRMTPDGVDARTIRLGIAGAASHTFYALHDISSRSALGADGNVSYAAVGTTNAAARLADGERSETGNIGIPAAILDTQVEGVATPHGLMRHVTIIGNSTDTCPAFTNMVPSDTGTRTRIYIGGSVERIQDHAFHGSRTTRALRFGHNWVPSVYEPTLSIGKYAFADLELLGTPMGATPAIQLVLPLAVTSIGDYAFAHNLALVSATLETHGNNATWAAGQSKLTSVGDYAFWANRSMTTLFVLPVAVNKVGFGAFDLTNITSFVSGNADTAPNGFYFTNNGNLYLRVSGTVVRLVKYAPGRIVDPEDGIVPASEFSASMTHIDESAFSYNRIIRFLTLPAGVVIADGAFKYTYEILETVTLSPGSSTANVHSDAFRNTTLTVRVPAGDLATWQSHLNLPAARVIAA